MYGYPCNFKTVFIRRDLGISTFDCLTSKAYHCCVRLSWSALTFLRFAIRSATISAVEKVTEGPSNKMITLALTNDNTTQGHIFPWRRDLQWLRVPDRIKIRQSVCKSRRTAVSTARSVRCSRGLQDTGWARGLDLWPLDSARSRL